MARIDRAYAVDVGGNIYRIDLENASNSDRANWTSYKLAALQGGATSTRKFFFPPDVVQGPNFVAVMAGSGDREKPLNQSSTDAFFTVMDMNIGYKPAITPSPITPATMAVIGDTSTSGNDGCYLNMENGEKIVNAPVTSLGVSYFATNKPVPPSSNSCVSNLARAKIYAAPLFCKVATSQTLTGGGPASFSGDRHRAGDLHRERADLEQERALHHRCTERQEIRYRRLEDPAVDHAGAPQELLVRRRAEVGGAGTGQHLAGRVGRPDARVRRVRKRPGRRPCKPPTFRKSASTRTGCASSAGWSSTATTRCGAGR